MKNKKKNVQLVIIDAQNDFCDLPIEYCPIINGAIFKPALPVPGANVNCLTVAGLIDVGGRGIGEIDAYNDTHPFWDMGHFSSYADSDGNPLTEPTRITLEDVLSGKFTHRLPGGTEKIINYLKNDDVEAIYTWPVHCQQGTYGHNIHPAILAACTAWENSQLGFVNYIQKGLDPWSEHYSGIQAKVVDPAIPSTALLTESISRYEQADMVIFVGEASSHCVSATILDVVNNVSAQDRKKLVVLTDCMSAIPGYEEKTQEFFNDMAKMGVRITTSTEILPELIANGQ